MASTRTLQGIEDNPGEHEADADYLVIAFDCAQPLTAPARLWLDVPEVAIGRGPRRSWARRDRTLRLELPDPWISVDHARLRRLG